MQDSSEYLIKEGDCLWNISVQFLGDPHKWPQIWQLNQNIKNPDLIYPGNPIRVPRNDEQNISSHSSLAQNSALTSQTPSLIEKGESGKTLFNQSQAYENDSTIISTLKEKRMLSAGFFEQTPFLWTLNEMGDRVNPGSARVDKPENAAYQRFDTIKISCINPVYNSGDTVELYKSIRKINFKGKTADIVKMTGRAIVTNIEKKKLSAELFEMNEPITGDEWVAKQKPLSALVVDSLVDPEVSIQAKVFTRVEDSRSVYPFQTLILDKGAKDGVKEGDIFAVSRNYKGSDSETVSAVCFTAFVTEESSSIVIIRMADGQIKDGDGAALIRRITSSKVTIE